MGEVVVVRVIDLLIDELDERRQLKLQLQLGLLERELRLMLAVLDYIESLEGPSQDMNRWAEDARDVVNVYFVMGFRPFRPNYFTCTAHLYLYCTLLVPHTYASYIRH